MVEETKRWLYLVTEVSWTILKDYSKRSLTCTSVDRELSGHRSPRVHLQPHKLGLVMEREKEREGGRERERERIYLIPL